MEDGTNLNNIKIPGNYYSYGGSTLLNSPAAVGSALGLEVFKCSGNYIVQRATMAGSVGTEIYIREFQTDWSGWSKIVVDIPDTKIFALFDKECTGDINDAYYKNFGFYSGRNLTHSPVQDEWFQFITFPFNGNPKYPVQIGFCIDIDNSTNNKKLRVFYRHIGETESWTNTNWKEILITDKS